jgi:radical SAM superfamily enzyme YgiQ (UPF0313 family)
MKELLQDADIKFRCFGRADVLMDEIVCEGLRDIGVVEVGIGVESGSDEILSRNFKKTTAAMNSLALQNLRKFGIRVKTFIIIGLPGETHGTVNDTLNWLIENNPDDVDFSVFQPMPGSPIFKNPEAYGIEFKYDSNPMWYKGTPDQYSTSIVHSGGLTGKEIEMYRTSFEKEFKRKDLLK